MRGPLMTDTTMPHQDASGGHFNVMLLDDGDIGWCVQLIGPYPTSELASADEPRIHAYAAAKGYRQEYDDYFAFSDVTVMLPPRLDDRSAGGRFLGLSTEQARAAATETST